MKKTVSKRYRQSLTGSRSPKCKLSLWPVALVCCAAALCVPSSCPILFLALGGLALLITVAAAVLEHREKALARRRYRQSCARDAAESLLTQQYCLVDNARPGHGQRYDSVLIGPGGLFLLECDMHSGSIHAAAGKRRFIAQTLAPLRTLVDIPFANPLHRAARRAAQLERTLAKLGLQVPVRPVVLFPRAAKLERPSCLAEEPLFAANPPESAGEALSGYVLAQPCTVSEKQAATALLVLEHL